MVAEFFVASGFCLPFCKAWGAPVFETKFKTLTFYGGVVLK